MSRYKRYDKASNITNVEELDDLRTSGRADMEKLPSEERQRIFHYMDLIIRDYKTKQAYGS